MHLSPHRLDMCIRCVMDYRLSKYEQMGLGGRIKNVGHYLLIKHDKFKHIPMYTMYLPSKCRPHELSLDARQVHCDNKREETIGWLAE